MVDKLGLNLIHRNLAAGERRKRADAPIGEAAGVDEVEPVKVGRDIHRKTVHRDAV